MRGFSCCVALLVIFGAAAIAQRGGSGSGPDWTFNTPYSSVASFSGAAAMGRPITGAPYSATQVTEHTQTLADGTHITQKPQTTLMYRDSQGRTRTEHAMFAGPNGDGPRMIQIFDPVAGFQYTLDTQNQVAHRVPMNHNGSSFLLGAAPPPPPPPPNGATVRTGQVGGVVGAPSASTSSQATRPEVANEQLGTQTMEGVNAIGHRMTTTFPVGSLGNDRPITTVTESWFSPDLKLAVLTKHSDPRSGESTTRLTNIVLGEPDPALFQPPPDYNIVDEQGPFQIRSTK